MTRPRLLDLFSGAGGAAKGYHDAGFDVIGVDIRPQPRYPYEFHQADALTYPLDGFDAIHASPPCQAYTTMSNRHRGAGGKADSHLSLIDRVRAELELTWSMWVIENVAGARSSMRNPITLHGGMFGLGVQRPRLFESNVLLLVAPAPAVTDPIGVYGKAHDGRRLFDRADGTTQYAARTLEQAQAAMGIDWMTWDELREAIPPAYTRWNRRPAHRPPRGGSMTRLLAVAGVVYGTVALGIGALQAINYRQSGGGWRGTLAWGLLATITGPIILAQAIKDWYR